jgi:vacuolar-type H+-ATPase subunit I/STV1
MSKIGTFREYLAEAKVEKEDLVKVNESLKEWKFVQNLDIKVTITDYKNDQKIIVETDCPVKLKSFVDAFDKVNPWEDKDGNEKLRSFKDVAKDLAKVSKLTVTFK